MTAASTSPESRCPTTSTVRSGPAAKAPPVCVSCPGGADRRIPDAAVPGPGGGGTPLVPDYPQPDFEVDEDRDEDLLQALERELARRRFGSPVRLEVADDMTESMFELLLRELDVHPGDVIQVPGLLDLSSLWQVYGVDRPDLKDRPFVPC